MTLNQHGHIEPQFPPDKPMTIEDRIILMEAKLDEQIRLLNMVVDAVKPALDAMADSPLGRMFGMESKS